ncbi:MAG: hypothetical protein A2992_00560 [Elusimicrobia bacterium RIFCSPLOWO2_01_FULL_59_12]|nr:MAG: hypothetical protein A2992_00560 [Elusimicrobia bacterium RIFCSPLOWO2_01_FULL_59_12]
MRSHVRALGLLTLLMGVLVLPFVTRAYFVDDYYFVTMAKGILEHPARPYDFRSDDAGIANIAWERGKQPRMVNPPLFHYFLAAVMKIGGGETWKLRTASLIFPLISLYAMYFLGKRFVRDPLAAASLMAVTPAFWLTSYSLLIDSALLAFFLAALACFIIGHEEKRMGLLWFSGALMGLTFLTKYTGALILPVALVWHALHRERCSITGTLAAFGVCAIIFLLWGVWGIMTYGQMHFIATFSRGFHPATLLGLGTLGLFVLGSYFWWKEPARRHQAVTARACWGFCLILWIVFLWMGGSVGTWLQNFYFDKIISVASFLGGTTVFLFWAPSFLCKRDARTFGIWLAVAGLLYVAFSSRIGGFNRLQSAQLAFFIGSTLAFMIHLLRETSPRSSKPQRYLLIWLVVGLLELIIVMPWTAARYLLIILPPVCWVFRRWVEDSGRVWLWRWAWGMTALMGAALAYVDYAQAGTILPLTQVLETQQAQFQKLSPRPPNHWYYLADTFDGSQPYILRLGWENVFPFQSFPRGSLFLRSRFRKSSWWNIKNPERFAPVAAWEFNSRIPLRVMDIPASAGFYASCWGILPYAITRHPLERFELNLVN